MYTDCGNCFDLVDEKYSSVEGLDSVNYYITDNRLIVEVGKYNVRGHGLQKFQVLISVFGEYNLCCVFNMTSTNSTMCLYLWNISSRYYGSYDVL
jgi:hypothetical protein